VNDRTVEAYSKMLNVSTGFLNKICRQFSGLSAQQMIHYKLVSEIKKQLYQNKSAKEIAYEFGFSDPLQFQPFLQISGSTPQQYRKNI
jgi:AraC-like DNA-binding protein